MAHSAPISLDLDKPSRGLSLINTEKADHSSDRKKMTFAESHGGATNVWDAYANMQSASSVSK